VTRLCPDPLVELKGPHHKAFAVAKGGGMEMGKGNRERGHGEEKRKGKGTVVSLGGPPRVTLSRGWQPNKINFLRLNLQRIVDKH